MTFARIENNIAVEYPLFAGEIQRRFPNVSWVVGQFDPPDGYVRVQNVPAPAFEEASESLTEGMPELSGGAWRQTWAIATVPQTTITERRLARAKLVREERWERLRASDWTQLADAGLDPARLLQWTQYRQDLRDLPNQTGFPWRFTWPVSPVVSA